MKTELEQELMEETTVEEEGALTGVRRQGCSLVQPCIQGHWQASSVVDSLNFLTRASVMGHLHCQPGWI